VLLTILNECLQGGASGLGFLLAGTPDALEDPDRGLFTVPSLRSRLQPCAPRGCIDYGSPVLRLEPLGREELLVLLHNVRRVHALGDESKYRLPTRRWNSSWAGPSRGLGGRSWQIPAMSCAPSSASSTSSTRSLIGAGRI